MDEPCQFHPERKASTHCFDCMQAICARCVQLDGVHDMCSGCLAPKLAKRRRTRLTVASGVASVVIAALMYLALKGNPLRYGKESFEIMDLEASVEKEPCEKDKVLSLAEMYLRAEDPRKCLALSDAYLSKCGDWPRLRWSRYAAFKRLSEYDNAIAEASLLIESSPYDHDYWWWRGQAYEQASRLESAADDYRQALIIEPKLGNIPFNLAAVYEKLGRPCDAIWPLEQFLSTHPEHLDNRRVRAQLDRYYEDSRCAAIRGTGNFTMRFVPGAGVIWAEAKVNGVKGRFIIDTGATLVALTPKFAKKANFDGAMSTKITL
jgi:tetratricopeptide (TPR) repeat protein